MDAGGTDMSHVPELGVGGYSCSRAAQLGECGSLAHQTMLGLSGRIVGRAKKAADIAQVEIGLKALQVPI